MIDLKKIVEDLDKIINSTKPSQDGGFHKIQMEILELRSKYAEFL